MTWEMNNSENNTPDNVFSVSSWALDEETPAMKGFQTNYSALYNDAPNVISLLGYEVGLTVVSCFGESSDMPAKIGDFAKSLVFETPRGELTFSRYNESLVQTNKVKQFLSDGNQHKNTVVNTFDLSEQEDLYDKFKDLPYSGWQNPYLIT